MKRGLIACALLTVLTFILWAGPNQPQAGDVTMPAGKFNFVSYAPYRAWQSPLDHDYPTGAEVAKDLALIATQANGIRTYSAIEGDYDIGALAKQAGLKVWLGIWLGANPKDNAKEIAAGIAEANAHPDTITRVVVGNEVLLRRDLSVERSDQADRLCACAGKTAGRLCRRARFLAAVPTGGRACGCGDGPFPALLGGQAAERGRRDRRDPHHHRCVQETVPGQDDLHRRGGLAEPRPLARSMPRRAG